MKTAPFLPTRKYRNGIRVGKKIASAVETYLTSQGRQADISGLRGLSN
jgi:hypothetical protein